MSVTVQNSKYPGCVTRKTAVYIFIAGHMDHLVMEGKIKQEIILTPKAQVVFNELVEMGFKPTEEETTESIKAIRTYFRPPNNH